MAPGYDPGGEDASGVVAFSNVDAVPDGAGQGGGPIMGHDGGHRGVDPPGRVLAFLGQPGAAGILAEHGVADVAGQPAIARVGELAVDHSLIEPGRGRGHPAGGLWVLQDWQPLAVQELEAAGPAERSAAISRTRQRRHACRMACSTSTMGTWTPAASHSSTRSTCGRWSTVATIRTVVSPLKEPSNAKTTSVPSGMVLVASVQSAQAPSGSQASSTPTHWPSRYRRKAFSLILGGRVARKASRWRKPSNAGLATAQAASSSTAQPAGAANSVK